MKLTKCLLLGGLMAGTALTTSARENVVLFIADGMGPAHLQAASAAAGGLSFESFPYTGSLNPGNADSAAAATAMATGYQSPVNGVISMDPCNQAKMTIIEWAKSKKMCGGIVTTHDIGAPVPGAFGAHQPSWNSEAIRWDYLKADATYFYAPSLPDMLLGGGVADPAYVSLAQSLKYDVVTTAEALSANITVNKILGLFGTGSQPTLSQMVDKAMTRLASNPFGTFLVVETGNSTEEIADLDQAVQAVQNWAASASQNVLIIVTSTGDGSGGLVPLYMSDPGWVAASTLQSTEIFYLAQDVLVNRLGAVAPVVSGLTVSAITPTSATVTWTTAEPTYAALQIQPLGSVTASAVGTADRSSQHAFDLSGLSANTAYIIKASGTDLIGTNGSATTTFITPASTPGGDSSAYVFFDPAYGPGTKPTGTVADLRAASDNKTQTISETTDGAGLGLAILYTLQTPLARQQVGSISISSKPTWTALDGTADTLISSIGIPAPDGSYYWEKITTFPLAPNTSLLGNYVDPMGNILVRFEDSTAKARERKDTLTLDSLYATVATRAAAAAPTGPKDTTVTVKLTSPLAVNLSWSDFTGEAIYQLWRKAGTNDWAPLTTIPAGQKTWSDSAVVAGTNYSYAVRALNSAGFCDGNMVSVLVPVPPPPPVVLQAPGSLNAVQGKTGITVSWTDTNTGETGYELLKQCGTVSTKFPLAANSKSYLDKTYVKGTLTTYTLHAVNNGVVGPDAVKSITPK